MSHFRVKCTEVNDLVFNTGIGVIKAPAHVVFDVLTDERLQPSVSPNWKSSCAVESMPPGELKHLQVGGTRGAHGIAFEVVHTQMTVSGAHANESK